MQRLSQVAKAHRFAVMQPAAVDARNDERHAVASIRVARPKAVPTPAQALQTLYAVCLGMDLENRMLRPTEADYQAAMAQAGAAIAQATGAA
jgi:hypothetical protein